MEPGDATKLTVYTGDSFRYGHKKLYHAIVEALHEEGIAGATVLRGIEGYGADKQIHPARILDLSGDLPVVIIAVDRTEKSPSDPNEGSHRWRRSTSSWRKNTPEWSRRHNGYSGR